jgi:cytoskeletal protein RodZ
VLAALASVPAPQGLVDTIWDSLPRNNRPRVGRRLRKVFVGVAVVLVGLGAGTVAAEYLPVGATTTTAADIVVGAPGTTTSTTSGGSTTSSPSVADESATSTTDGEATDASDVTVLPPTTTTTTTLAPTTTTTTATTVPATSTTTTLPPTTTTTTLPPTTTTTTTTAAAPNDPPSNLAFKAPKDGAQLAVNLTGQNKQKVWEGTIAGSADDENRATLVYEWFSDQVSDRLAVGQSATIQLELIGGNRTIHVLTMRVTDEFGLVSKTTIKVTVVP